MRSIMLAAFFALALSSGGAVADADSGADDTETVYQAEQKLVLPKVIALAELCRGKANCFQPAIRPMGPLHVAAEPSQSVTPGFVKEISNFAFGSVSAAADIDPATTYASLFCGEACLFSRRDKMLAHLAALRSVAAQFNGQGWRSFALWPDGSLLIDNRLVKDGMVMPVDRSAKLHLLLTRSFDPSRASAVPESEQTIIREILNAMIAGEITAITRDETGGLRFIHTSSYTTNETGLLFVNDGQKQRVDRGVLSNGARYRAMSEVRPGVLFYLRS